MQDNFFYKTANKLCSLIAVLVILERGEQIVNFLAIPDNLNGHVVMEARRLGLASPVNAAIIELSHRIEQGSLKPEPANFHLSQDLVGQLSKSAERSCHRRNRNIKTRLSVEITSARTFISGPLSMLLHLLACQQTD